MNGEMSPFPLENCKGGDIFQGKPSFSQNGLKHCYSEYTGKGWKRNAKRKDRKEMRKL
jgi:hypothetical protein